MKRTAALDSQVGQEFICRDCGLFFDSREDLGSHGAANHAVTQYESEINKKPKRNRDTTEVSVLDELEKASFAVNSHLSPATRQSLQTKSSLRSAMSLVLEDVDCRFFQRCQSLPSETVDLQLESASASQDSQSNVSTIQSKSKDEEKPGDEASKQALPDSTSNSVEILKLRSNKGVSVCDFCQKVFKQRASMLEHRRSHTKEKPYSCPVCGLRFSLSGSRNRHVRVAHPLNFANGNLIFSRRPRLPNPIQLENLVGSSKSSEVNKETKTVRGAKMDPADRNAILAALSRSEAIRARRANPKKTLVCEFCQKVFQRQASLIEHRRSHTKERPYSCPICGLRFTLSGSRNRHVRVAHPSAYDFTNHHLKAAFGRKTKNQSRICEYCQKVFKRPSTLLEHLRTHTREKPYPCPLCGNYFSLVGSRNRHIKTVHGITLENQAEVSLAVAPKNSTPDSIVKSDDPPPNTS